ncbi:MAG TPA: hypothetical protein VGM11_02690 [Acidobacteriaceae bacterium]
MAVASANARAAEKPKLQGQAQPWVQFSLASLGVPPIPTAFLQAGASMMTLDLVDDTHLLLTFGTRGLVPRVPGDPPDDEDRMVAAELVELPTGKVLARADWHMHDHGRYLWRLGKGRFLIRCRRDLFVITPEAWMKTDQPLRPLRFPARDGMPVAAVMSPDKEMLMLETMEPQKKENVESSSGGVIVNESKPQVMIDFYRLKGGDEAGSVLEAKAAGLVRASAPILLPADSDGYLWPGDPTRGRWPVSFNEFGGREVKVGAVDSSCEPRLQMVSRFEFLAFACMGQGDRTRMKSYGMDGHETWEDSLGATVGVPEFAFAPAAGRFAMSRVSSPADDPDDTFLGAGLPATATQEVRVYQTESGDLLLKVATTPVMRFPENFDLSEDGSLVAVVSNGAVDVYRLPEPSKQDLKELQEARSFSPPQSQADVRFTKLEMPDGPGAGDVASAEPRGGEAAGSGPAGGGSGASATRTTSQTDVEGDGPGGSSAPVAGDVSRASAGKAAMASAGVRPNPGAQAGDESADVPRRKPPTLLEPGETVEPVKGSGQPPQ